jgi:hypothetical protein
MILRVAPCDNFNDSTTASALPANGEGAGVVVDDDMED